MPLLLVVEMLVLVPVESKENKDSFRAGFVMA
jgi:hypothetical protein